MDRRKFLRGSLLTLVAAPAWLSCAFQKGGTVDPENPDEIPANIVGRAYLQAQKQGKPLLVIVVPTNANQKYQRGHAFGEYLNHGGFARWPLATCEMLCANTAELSTLVSVTQEPLMYLLEDDGGTIKATALDASLPDLSYGRGDWNEEPKEINQRISVISQLVHQHLAKDEAMLKARAQKAKKAFGEEANDIEAQLQAGKKPTPAAAERFAVLVAGAAAEANSTQNKELLGLLEAVAAEKFASKRINGSRWANASGCGTHYEDATPEELEREGMMDCGMGFVPTKSSRFLSFYTLSEAI